MTKLFIYGTLKQGYRRSHCLEGQTFLGNAQTVTGYRLYDAGSYPAMIHDGQDLAVHGELWEVDAVCLQRLDEIEAVPTLYQRAVVELVLPQQDSVQAYLYKQSLDGWVDIGSSWPAESTV